MNTIKASVNYGDFEGTAAADHHDRRGLSDLAEKYGIDTDRYYVFGLDVSLGEIRDDDHIPSPQVTLLATDKNVVKAGSIDFVRQHAESHDGTLPYVRLNINATIEDVLLCFKRINVVFTNRVLNGVREYRLTS